MKWHCGNCVLSQLVHFGLHEFAIWQQKQQQQENKYYHIEKDGIEIHMYRVEEKKTTQTKIAKVIPYTVAE